MKKLVATAPRVAALVEYEDRAILANEVKIACVSAHRTRNGSGRLPRRQPVY